LRKDPDVELKELPQEVFDELRRHASDAVSELSERDEWSARVAKSVFEFMEKSSAYQDVSELAYLNMRVRGR
jgi:TRAP-type mannitol/chloroaromatic compound transport system substrate-binding protein